MKNTNRYNKIDLRRSFNIFERKFRDSKYRYDIRIPVKTPRNPFKLYDYRDYLYAESVSVYQVMTFVDRACYIIYKDDESHYFNIPLIRSHKTQFNVNDTLELALNIHNNMKLSWIIPYSLVTKAIVIISYFKWLIDTKKIKTEEMINNEIILSDKVSIILEKINNEIIIFPSNDIENISINRKLLDFSSFYIFCAGPDCAKSKEVSVYEKHYSS